MENAPKRISYITWWEYYQLVQQLYRKLTEIKFSPDIIVGLARGGLWTAKYLANSFGIPSSSIRVTRTGSNEAFAKKGNPIIVDKDFILKTSLEGKKVLLVDEITSYGHSLLTAYNALQSLNPQELKTATLTNCLVDKEKVINPEIVIATYPINSWHYFPWEIELNETGGIMSLFKKTLQVQEHIMNQETSLGKIENIRISNSESKHYEKTLSIPLKNDSQLENIISDVEMYLKKEFEYEEKPSVKMYRDTYYKLPISFHEKSFRIREIYSLSRDYKILNNAELMTVCVYEDKQRREILPDFSPEHTEIFLIRGINKPLDKYEVGLLKNILHLELRERDLLRLAEIEKIRIKHEISTAEDGDRNRMMRPVKRVAFDIINKIILPEVVASKSILSPKVVGGKYLSEIEINNLSGKEGVKFATDISSIMEKYSAKPRPGRKIDWIDKEKSKIVSDKECVGFMDV
jgi:hypoxanthine phosphoribosyltransferase